MTPPATAVFYVVGLTLLAAAITGFLARLATRVGFVARPRAVASRDGEPVPYLGGLAIFAAWMLGLFTAGTGGAGEIGWQRVAAALWMLLAGTWDDHRPFRPGHKLLAIAIGAAGYLAAQGEPFGASLVGDLLVLLVVTNAYNLIDVMDGLLAVVSVVGIGGLVIGAGAASAGARLEALLMLPALLGFFWLNRPPARIYAGDGGSLMLGFLFGAWCLDAKRSASTPSPALLGILAVPLLEISLLIPARLARGLPPWLGSPDHYSVRLQRQAGWTRWRVLAATALLGLLWALAPALTRSAPPPWTAGYAALSVGLAAAAWLACWRLPPRQQGQAPGGSSLA